MFGQAQQLLLNATSADEEPTPGYILADLSSNFTIPRLL